MEPDVIMLMKLWNGTYWGNKEQYAVKHKKMVSNRFIQWNIVSCLWNKLICNKARYNNGHVIVYWRDIMGTICDEGS